MSFRMILSEAPFSLYAPAWVLVGASVYMGVDGSAFRELVALAGAILGGMA